MNHVVFTVGERQYCILQPDHDPTFAIVDMATDAIIASDDSSELAAAVARLLPPFSIPLSLNPGKN